jgi:uncharacterized protein (TIGR00661 family)
MAPALRSLGHQVHAVFSGPPPDGEWTDGLFDTYVHHRGFTFTTVRGRVRYLNSAFNLHFRRFWTDVYGFDASGYDLVVTDFEPISAYVARIRGIPSIGVGHMYAFYHKVPVPGLNPIPKLVMRHFAPARRPLGLHWHHFNQSILPPTIPPDVRPGGGVIPNKILVYLPFEDPHEAAAFLKPFDDYQFYLYSRVDSPEDRGHIHFRPFSRPGFLRDLSECAGVMANGGFSLASEALHLGKKLLVKPVIGQMEQQSNALVLKKLNLGAAMQTFDPAAARRWLESPDIEPQYYPNVVDHLTRWIDRGRWRDSAEFTRQVWAEAGRPQKGTPGRTAPRRRTAPRPSHIGWRQ